MGTGPNDHHDEHAATLEQDLLTIESRMRGRRQMLSWLLSGGVTAAVLAACGGDGSVTSSSTSTSSGSTSTGSTSTGSSGSTTSSSACVADPSETNGPFPADGTNSLNGSVVNVLTQSGIVRSDITSSFGSSTTTAPGVPMTLTLNIENTNNACELLIGYAIYIWHCDRNGEYSLYASDLTQENYLRGVQVTDSNGQVTFTTIFPACYSGRYPHIHVEIYKSLSAATKQSNAVLTTQLAMPRDICQTVYANATGYSQSVTNLSQVTTSSDNVFNSSTSAQLTAQTPTMTGDVRSGYVATATIGISV
jgi:protocatechuate 3,4-dioxygenase beta subunit